MLLYICHEAASFGCLALSQTTLKLLTVPASCQRRLQEVDSCTTISTQPMLLFIDEFPVLIGEHVMTVPPSFVS